jgi:hypothetical protein
MSDYYDDDNYFGFWTEDEAREVGLRHGLSVSPEGIEAALDLCGDEADEKDLVRQLRRFARDLNDEGNRRQALADEIKATQEDYE